MSASSPPSNPTRTELQPAVRRRLPLVAIKFAGAVACGTGIVWGYAMIVA